MVSPSSRSKRRGGKGLRRRVALKAGGDTGVRARAHAHVDTEREKKKLTHADVRTHARLSIANVHRLHARVIPRAAIVYVSP